MDVKNRFIILRKTRYGEADLIIQALSPSGASMSFMARAALRSKKRFGGGVLDPLHFVQFTYQASPDGKLNVLKEAELINDFPGLRKDYDRLEFSLKILEAVGKVSQEGDSNSEFLFNLLGNTLKVLEQTESLEAVKLHFWLKFLLQQGVLTPEPWMAIFLKTNISESASIAEAGAQEARRVPGLEMLVEQYIKTASL